MLLCENAFSPDKLLCFVLSAERAFTSAGLRPHFNYLFSVLKKRRRRHVSVAEMETTRLCNLHFFNAAHTRTCAHSVNLVLSLRMKDVSLLGLFSHCGCAKTGPQIAAQCTSEVSSSTKFYFSQADGCVSISVFQPQSAVGVCVASCCVLDGLLTDFNGYISSELLENPNPRFSNCSEQTQLGLI